jgi:hypothetical protein
MSWITDLDKRLHNVDIQLKGYLWPAICIAFVVIGLIFGLRFDFEGLGYSFSPEVFPVNAVNWMEDNTQEGEMFNYFIWGGYLLYRQWPVQRVFIDGQADLDGEGLTQEYMIVMNVEEGWKNILEKYKISWIILPKNNAAANTIHSELSWCKVYEDGIAVILRKSCNE